MNNFEVPATIVPGCPCWQNRNTVRFNAEGETFATGLPVNVDMLDECEKAGHIVVTGRDTNPLAAEFGRKTVTYKFL